jgi:hypothetical protein
MIYTPHGKNSVVCVITIENSSVTIGKSTEYADTIHHPAHNVNNTLIIIYEPVKEIQ